MVKIELHTVFINGLTLYIQERKDTTDEQYGCSIASSNIALKEIVLCLEFSVSVCGCNFKAGREKDL